METRLGMLGMPLIVTMPMKRKFVAQFFPCAQAFGEEVIDFYQVFISEKESTPTAGALLFLKEFAQGSLQQGVLFEPGAPIQKVSVVGAGLSPHFKVALDWFSGMPFEYLTFLVSKHPLVAWFHVPVFVMNPLPALSGVSAVGPSAQLLIHQMVTAGERLGGYHRSVVVRPAPDNRIEGLNQLVLRG